MSKIILSLILFSAISLNGLSQPNRAKELKISTLQEAWDYALKNNPDQVTYQSNIEKAKFDLKVSEGARLPAIGGSFAGQINTQLPTTPIPGQIFGKPGQTMDIRLGKEFNYNTGISATKTFLDWQNRILIKLAKNDLLTTRLQSEAYRQELKQQVALYYYSALITGQALSAYKKNLILADSTVSLTNQKFSQGLINALSANLSVINRNNINLQIMSTETLLAQCRNALRILLGIDIHTGMEVVSSDGIDQHLPEAHPNLGKDPNLEIQESQVKNIELKVSLQKSAFAPKFSWNAYLGRQQFRDDFGMSLQGADWHPVTYFGLNMQVPIFNGFSNLNKLKSSRVELQKSQSAWKESLRKAIYNDELLLFEFHQSRKAIQPAAANYQLYEQNRRLASQQFIEGLISMDSYFKIFEDYLNAENAYLNTLSSLFTFYSTIISRQ